MKSEELCSQLSELVYNVPVSGAGRLLFFIKWDMLWRVFQIFKWFPEDFVMLVKKYQGATVETKKHLFFSSVSCTCFKEAESDTPRSFTPHHIPAGCVSFETDSIIFWGAANAVWKTSFYIHATSNKLTVLCYVKVLDLVVTWDIKYLLSSKNCCFFVILSIFLICLL